MTANASSAISAAVGRTLTRRTSGPLEWVDPAGRTAGRECVAAGARRVSGATAAPAIRALVRAARFADADAARARALPEPAVVEPDDGVPRPLPRPERGPFDVPGVEPPCVEEAAAPVLATGEDSVGCETDPSLDADP